jgi:hypothetical protein
MTLSLAFSLADGTPPTGLSRGHIALAGDRGRATSPPVAVFLSIVDLLDGLAPLLSGPPSGAWEWIGHDSSFQVVFRRAGGRVAVEALRAPVGDASEHELALAVWRAADGFAAAHPLPPSDLVYADLRAALEEFHDRFVAGGG